jgi:hypothetical protein
MVGGRGVMWLSATAEAPTSMSNTLPVAPTNDVLFEVLTRVIGEAV